MADPNGEFEFSVVTYNVLGQYASNPESFPKCNPLDCYPGVRLERIKKKLLPHLHTKSIICLQEVTEEWYRDELLDWFRDNGYTAFHVKYGETLFGSFGVLIAYLTSLFSMSACLESNVASEIVGRGYDAAEIAAAKGRRNRTLCVGLRHATGRIAICTYHMPVAHRTPAVMEMHAKTLLKLASIYAIGDPFIIAGDFNSRPCDPAYEILTEDDVMMDAYWHIEQKHTPTTHAFIKKGNRPAKPFKETVDYIFYNDHLTCMGIQPLPDVDGFLPNETEPSDHLLLKAWFKLAKPTSAADKKTQEE